MPTSSKACLEKNLLEAVEHSFNRICIDGDMSTNDTVLALANGAAGGPTIARGSKGCRQFRDALSWVLLKLAKAIVRDGERVTKFVTLEVKGAPTYLDAKKVAEAVSQVRPGEGFLERQRPELGPRHPRRRILAGPDPRGAHRHRLRRQARLRAAACVADTPISELQAIADRDRFTITINLHLGRADYTLYTSDISPEYIDFNRSEYAYWKNTRHA